MIIATIVVNPNPEGVIFFSISGESLGWTKQFSASNEAVLCYNFSVARERHTSCLGRALSVLERVIKSR